MKRLLGTLALAAATLASAPAAAQEIQIRGPLAGARSVSRLVRYREGRFAITPTVGITIQDEFSRDMFFGVRADYHFTDWLGVGIGGLFAPVHIDTALTDQVGERSPANSPNVATRAGFTNQVGRRNFQLDLHATFIPLRGKFALFQNLVADLDLYIVAGVAAVGVEERAGTESDRCQNFDDASMGAAVTGGLCSSTVSATAGRASAIQTSWRNSQNARASRLAIAPTFGFGLNFFINRFISVNVEYRATPFSWNRSGTDESSTENRCGPAGNESCEGFSDIVATYFATQANQRVSRITSEDRSLNFNQMVSLGVTFFLPTSPRIGP